MKTFWKRDEGAFEIFKVSVKYIKDCEGLWMGSGSEIIPIETSGSSESDKQRVFRQVRVGHLNFNDNRPTMYNLKGRTTSRSTFFYIDNQLFDLKIAHW